MKYDDCDTWPPESRETSWYEIEYKLDHVIAYRIKELRLGLNGCNEHSWRAISILITGKEDGYTGQQLCRLAQWTLGEEWED